MWLLKSPFRRIPIHLEEKVFNSDSGDISVSTITTALPKRMGNVPFWRGNDDLQELILFKIIFEGFGRLVRHEDLKTNKAKELISKKY